MLVDGTTRTSRISSPSTPRGRRLGPPRRPPTRPNPQRPWLRSRIDMAKTPFQGNSSIQERRPRSMAPPGNTPPRPAQGGFDASRKTTLQRLENIYHRKFTCFNKVSRASMKFSARSSKSGHQAGHKRTDQPAQSIRLFLIRTTCRFAEPLLSFDPPPGKGHRPRIRGA